MTVLPRPVAFAGFAASMVAVYLGSGAPTPFLVVWQREFGFPESVLTLAFASYAFTFLAALLIGGSLSDHLGRKPVIVGSLLVGLVSLLMFVGATGVEWIVAARSLQGLSTGVVTAAYTAALVELARPGTRTGPVVAAATPVLGLGLGALSGGMAVEWWGTPADTILFTVFTVLLAVAVVIAVLAPETTTRVPGVLRSLAPHVVVPGPARSFFVRMLPLLVAAWMAGAVFLGLAPTIIQEILGLRSGLAGGFTASVHAFAICVGSVAFGRLTVRSALRLGGLGLVAGMALVVLGVEVQLLPVVWIGGLIEGLGFGAAFGAIFRGLAPLAPEHERAGTFAAVYVVSYLSFGLSAIVAGQLIGPLGLLPTILGWTVLIIVLAAIGFLIQLVPSRRVASAP